MLLKQIFLFQSLSILTSDWSFDDKADIFNASCFYIKLAQRPSFRINLLISKTWKRVCKMLINPGISERGISLFKPLIRVNVLHQNS